ncbi:MAG: DUF4405 domain-containing protein [Gammaproteobacteria bacterium]|jgi:hypothetical protein|nr:DUF4405 domain-containing protein [Gammaproteobacteria bacterium]
MRYDRSQLWREAAAGLAVWSLAALALTGLVLYAVLWTSPEEGAAPTLLGLSLDQWADVHDVLGIAFLVAALATLALGRPAWPVAPAAHGLAAAAVTVIVGLTLMHLPPATWLLPEGYPREAVESADEEPGALPYPGAGDEPLAAVAREMAMDPTRVVIALQEAGLHFESLDETLEAIAGHNGTTAAAVYDAIRHLEAPLLAPHEETPFDLVESRFMGHDVRGKTVAQLAEAASVPLDLALRRLRAAGIDAKPGELADTVASNSGVTPMDVLAALVVEGYRPRR